MNNEAIWALIGFSSRVLRASRDELQLHNDAFSSKSGPFGQIVSLLLQYQENILSQKEKHPFFLFLHDRLVYVVLSPAHQIQLNIPHPQRLRINVKFVNSGKLEQVVFHKTWHEELQIV